MKTFYIATLGCKVNQYESDGIATELINGGWIISDCVKDAEVCIINTCAVTSKAAVQSRQKIRSIIRANPNAKIIVTGCDAQTAPDEIRKIERVDIIADHHNKFKIASTILRLENYNKPNNSENYNKSEENYNKSEENYNKSEDSDNWFHTFKPAVTGNNTRAYLKIQDGCNSFCTYCIVPYARGRSKSMPADDVIEHLLNLSSKGYKEAILTGIHVGAYGLDFEKKSSLTNLMIDIARLKPIHRVRLSSIEPKELTDEIINIAAKKNIVCDHFHVPLQSGDDTILKNMGRPYNIAFFSNLIMKINNTIPTAAIGVDILEGFPGESDNAFENTLNLIDKLPISYLHVFPFSPRKGTPAYDYPNKVDTQTVKKRCKILRQLGFKKRMDFENRQMEQRKSQFESVIQDKRDSKTGKLIAITSNYLLVLVDGSDKLKRQIVQVGLNGREDGVSIQKRLVGKIIFN